MALGKYARIDSNKKPSRFCSAVTILAFVGVCFLGVWLMKTPYVVPEENLNVSIENNSGVEELGSETDKDGSAENNYSDVPEDVKEDITNFDTERNASSENQDEKPREKMDQKMDEKSEESLPETDVGDKKQDAKDPRTGIAESNSEMDEPDEESNDGSSKGETNPFGKKPVSVESDNSDSVENEKLDSGQSEKKPNSIDQESISESDGSEKRSDDLSETKDGYKAKNKTEEKAAQIDTNEPKEISVDQEDAQSTTKNTSEVFPSGAHSDR